MIETGKQYWRSLGELHGTPEFKQWLHREFQEGAADAPDATSRRALMKLMAASLGLAGLTACRRPEQLILPNAKGVEDYIPGKSYYYATAMALAGAASGLLVEVNDGRPTKVEGNPEHPFSLGAANAFQQASILSLYDPDRAKAVTHAGSPSHWDEFFAFTRAHFGGKVGKGEGLRFLSERIASPSLLAVKAHTLKRYPAAKWVEYEPVGFDGEQAGLHLAFGQRVAPLYRFDKADVVVALDCDFLGCDAGTAQPMKQFSKRRRVDSERDEMNRLYVVESLFSVTGAMADHRLRARSSDIRALAEQLAKQLGVTGELPVLPAQSQMQDRWIAAVAKDLQKNKGKSLMIAGPRQPAEVHALVALINQTLGNTGATVSYVKTGDTAFRPQLESLRELTSEMGTGNVQTILILGGNPVFTAPADVDFAANLKKVATTIHLSNEQNETSTGVQWHLPEAHFLEAWSDIQAQDGTCTVQQPMIQPLFNGKTAAELLAVISGYPDQRGFDIVHHYWKGKLGADGEKAWRRALHDGVIPHTQAPVVNPVADAKRIAPALAAVHSPSQGMEVVFTMSSHVYDGRFANNGWLQEAPDPMTKLVWDNAALMSPATATQLGLRKDDMIAIERNGRKIEVPVMEQPGHADNSITLAVGHGRTVCGRVGRGAGTNVYPLRTTDTFTFGTGFRVSKTGTVLSPPLATTQEHHSMEGRPLVREATLEEYRKEPDFAEKMAEHPPLVSLFQEHDWTKGSQWGMAIDLNTCIGCNACIVACQAENNIPIVGKEQVLKGREMHWIRMDRYYTDSPDDPQAVMQPVLCQQCENAPCEAVCPVAATVHSPEGLNDMAYNRCVGTRYCSNNCPYKVRRFNFFNWHKEVTEVGKMVFNPDVSVRMRGVMEKCNYCVQRIQEVKIQAKAEGHRPIRDGEIQTACQQTCPTDAIVFGDINDPNSRVARMKKQNRDYALLAELNVKPRTTYLAKLRNPNPELEPPRQPEPKHAAVHFRILNQEGS